MAAMSPGDRKAAKESSRLQSHPLDDPETVHALSSLCDIFTSSFGPQGHAKVIHNDCGGHVVLTTSSNRILSSLDTSKPVVKLVCSTLQDHLRVYSDGGSMAAILGLQLIMKGLDLKIHRRLIIEIYDMLLVLCLNYLQSENCPVKRKFDFQSSPELLNFIRHIFLSKPACLLYDSDLDHMCNLALETFLMSLPKTESKRNLTKNSNNLLYVILEGRPVQDSRLHSGILYQTPSIPVYRKCPLKKLRRCQDGKLRIALVETSMAGDADSFLDVSYQVPSDVLLADSVMEQLLLFVNTLVNCGITMLACQRVVHPRLKRELNQRDVLVLDRMGREYFSALHKLAGGDILNPFTAQPPSDLSSMLLDISHVVLANKSYVHLTGDADGHYGNPIHTVVLCHRSEEAVTEMKAICESVPHVLQHMMSQPYVLCGATCWVAALSYHIQSKMPSLTGEWTDSLGCSSLQLKSVIETFIAVLRNPVLSKSRTEHTASAIDINSGHLFILEDAAAESNIMSCQCGAVSYNDLSKLKYEYLANCKSLGAVQVKNVNLNRCLVADSLTTAMGVLKTALGIGCMILGIQNFVQDTN